ncbi:MAG: hypothetical protein IJ087_01400 [Eggerthellaceae bacterium]|nr:hypothetical protein [Eggerthellaceae bacterium]
MSGIKALDKLRAAGRNMAKGRNLENHEECNLLLIIADEIEAEVAESYMRLPCDADGVPIRPDDLMACTAFDTNDFDGKEHVMAVGNGFWVDKDGCTHIPSETRHVKPRTLEDVLRDVWKEALDYAKSDMWRSPDEVFAERADEIRAMFGEVDHD